MASLLRKKVNFDRHNKQKTILSDVEIGISRDNISGIITVRINSDPETGDEQYYLILRKDDIKKLEWLFKEI